MLSRHIRTACNLLLIAMFLTGLLGVQPASAQTEPPGERPQAAADGLSYGYDSDSGRLNFIGGSAGAPLLPGDPGISALADVDAAALALAEYGPAFGLNNPREELRLEKTLSEAQGATLRYQQQYRGIPVLGGELLLNRDTAGNVTSLNGEVSPNLSLGSVQPQVSAARAVSTALAGMGAWYGLAKSAVSTSEPELWVYDPAIFAPSTAKPALVWRVDLRADAKSGPVNELVLVYAASGRVALHFNQVNSAQEAQSVERAQERSLMQSTGFEEAKPEQRDMAVTPLFQDDSSVWYVAYWGSDYENCSNALTPCETVNHALDLAKNGDKILMAAGTYLYDRQQTIQIDKSISLVGGWNFDFSAREGYSILDGQYTKHTLMLFDGTYNDSASSKHISNLIFTRTGPVNNNDPYYSGSAVLNLNGNTDYTIRNSIVYANQRTPIRVINPRSFAAENLIIANNTTQEYPGLALYLSDNTRLNSTHLNNVSIINNTGTTGGGIATISDSWHDVYIKNSLIAGNFVAGAQKDCSMNFQYRLASEGYNFIQDATGCNFVTAGNDITGLDPMLDAPRSDGSYRLLPGSPAIDAGSPDEPGSASGCSAQDAAGNDRLVDGNGDGLAVCDIGAYENPFIPSGVQIERWDGSPQWAGTQESFSPLMARAIGADGLPLSGVGVTFQAPQNGPSGTFANGESQAVVVTNANGTAVAPAFTANSNTGSFVVEATLDGAAEPAQFLLENYSRVATLIRPIAGDNQVASPQQAFAVQMKAQVRDQALRPMAGVLVTFTAPASGAGGIFQRTGSNQVSVPTGPDGFATAPVFLSNTTGGAYLVVARAEGIEQEVYYRMSNSGFLYISPSGSDLNNNNCRYPENPCLTLQRAYLQASEANPVIYAASGAYTTIEFTIEKNLSIIGGWTTDFTVRSGFSEFIASDATKAALSIARATITLSGVRARRSSVGISVSQGSLAVSNCVLVNNGYGIRAFSSEVNIQNCTIGGNDYGLFVGERTSISHSTIAYNRLVGIEIINGAHTTTPVIENSIIAWNTRNCTLEYNNNFVSKGYNIIADTRTCRSDHTAIFVSHPTDKLNIDPLISPILIHDSHYALRHDSPAVDGANPASTPATDVRGATRPFQQRADIGSFEYTLPGPVETLQPLHVAPQIALPEKTFFSPLQVFAIDHEGSLVPDVTVDFAIQGSGADASFIDGMPKSATSVTGIDGEAHSPLLRVNEQTGWYQAFAEVAGSLIGVTLPLGNGMPTLFVDHVNGNDQNNKNNCRNAASPCFTINLAIEKSIPGDLIALAEGGIYTDERMPSRRVAAYIDRDLSMTGGWNPSFTQRTGRSIVDSCQILNANAVIEHVDFSNKSYQRIAGIDVYGGSIDLFDSNIYRTSIGVTLRKASANLVNIVIHDNQIGIENSWYGKLTLTNVIISHNTCQNGQGDCVAATGLVNRGEALLTNVTITDNRVYDFTAYYDSKAAITFSAGGIHNRDGTVKIINSIVANNLGYLGYDCLGEVISLGHNIIGNGDSCQFQQTETDLVGTWDHRINALAYPTPVEDGDIQTIPLLAGSPAIDSADAAACPQTDHRGMPRPAGAGCDIGAYEGSIPGDLPPVVVTLDAHQTTWFPGEKVCETPQTDCTKGVDPNADRAHLFALGAYQLFFDLFGRLSMDDAGMAILSTVHSGGNIGASWNGRQITYSDYFVVDDVGAHEYAHGVNQYSARLLNYYQSGAISESISDMWGEYYDQTNGMGSDDAALRWLIGEDLEEGAVRNMSDPTRFKHPDRMSSRYYRRDPFDNGEVHTNSGVNSKAVYLMVDGGTFNNLSIRALGWEKVLRLYYNTQMHYLTSGAGYDDLYMALNQSCTDMMDGPAGITADDCVQVRKALDAVEMSKAHSSFNPDAGQCPTGMYKETAVLFQDDFENSDSQWTFGAFIGNSRWSVVPGGARLYYAASGDHALFGDDYDPTAEREKQVSDTYAAISKNITIPAGKKVMLYFNHSYAFEYYLHPKIYIDGGVLEYSTDNGSTWRNASKFYEAGQKDTGKLYYGRYRGYNPMRGRSAFRGESHGYVASRYNLSTLAGKTVRFRWRMSTDYEGYFLGWAVDDVSIHTCVGKPAAPFTTAPRHKGLLTSYASVRLDWKDTTYATSYQVQIATDASFTGLVADAGDLKTSEYLLEGVLQPNTRYYWRVRGINSVSITGSWSSTRYFTTSLTAPALLVPEYGAVVTAAKPTFQWEASPGATSYSLQVSTSTKFSSNVISQTVKGTSYTSSKNLSAKKTYYWRVKANGANPSAYSPVFRFTIP